MTKTVFPNSPTAAAVRAARKRAKLTQEEAGALVYSSRRTWQDWEAGVAQMHPALWELFRLKVNKSVS
jgi:DNA-binding transcriptional regulator YiaG